MKENLSFHEEVNGIYRLKVPFEELYTSVFLVKSTCGFILVDCATTARDVEAYILPALKNTGLSLKDIRYLVLTHNHQDHAGGMQRLLELSPNLQVITTKQPFASSLEICEMKGHTLDCIGLLDKRSGTLLSGDALQGYGVGKYRCSLKSKEEYIKTIEKIKKDKRIENVLFSHAYEPWNTDGAFGREEVEGRLKDCIEYVERREKNESNRNQ